ncbi:precorrin-6y C5,15-methyltransferase (decarboxylating) subunit CbiE [Dongia sedimenti]|uniref:Precorrin-6y C5,15-methyltransferase (Decarboxylating) subunit CbiE n=1 Tax=Dongia sedimenti TaxID=3064282 RepID=A0ABU0YR13_9PROT|nr:precorrin-6y C5,15-methyltransferase (decarboxylating) subunit CbiE [Rhodospirillaceae bacterium R-7]
MSAWLTVIGIGEDGIDGLPPIHRATLAAAELIIGGERHLAMLGSVKAETQSWASPLSRTVEEILKRRGRPVVVLATGDPMHFGIGVTLAKRVARDEIAIHPHLSAFSLAAARLAWPLAEVECLTFHGRPIELLTAAVTPRQKLMILSHDSTTPGLVAARLAALGYGLSRFVVLEHMGGEKERVRESKAEDWRWNDVADLNTIAIDCIAGPHAKILHRGFGLPDEAFHHDGQLTKREIRAAALSALGPLSGELLWDVGAGCGSIAIEWLRHDCGLKAVAIERDAARAAMIRDNAAALGTPNLQLIEGAAPEALRDLPTPDAVFLGGGTGKAGVIDAVWDALRPGGRLVAHAVTIESEQALFAGYHAHGGDLTRLSVARVTPVGALHGWKPLMPVTQWRVVKGAEES